MPLHVSSTRAHRQEAKIVLYTLWYHHTYSCALNFIMSLFHASTCFEHMCLSSGGQNCIIQHLVSSHCRWPSRAQVERGLCTGQPPIGVMIPEAV